MSTPNHIIDTPLPLSQDFRQLKEKGRAFLQAHMNYDWTNLNASDPGITILDQLCYALTELGYCNDFPVKDILTNRDGGLQIDNEFYLPEDILTTAPYSVNDYRKYLIDGVQGVTNAVILQAMQGTAWVPQTYQVYLQVDNSIADTSIACKAAFAYLNYARNAGELFLLPQPLTPYALSLQGTIDIANAAQVETILAQVNTAVRNYIFPAVAPQGYTQLTGAGNPTNEIFDGPRLRNGWIPQSSLGEKRNTLTTLELVPLIEAIPGVNSVSALTFVANGAPVASPVTANANELFTINVADDFAVGNITVTSKSKTVAPETAPVAVADPGYEANILFGAAVDVQTDLPYGKFRDINTYYSIQHTFPETYGLGADAPDSGASDFQVAQARQLKGYLLLIDQVMANQFSQLANTARLFSFRNATTGAPSEQYRYYASKDKLAKNDHLYPVPYERFSPTYYFQSLYAVPQIKPLLKDNATFDYSYTPAAADVQEKTSWEKYKLDPYNAYIHGMMRMMEAEAPALMRRNEMLDHLLARHGESPALIDAFISGSSYTNDPLKDQVIFKSLYLQNYGLLSYHRYKGYNYLSADTLLHEYDQQQYYLPLFSEGMENNVLDGDTKDFVFNQPKIDRIEQLHEKDFVNFSGIELKLNLLFGLKTVYRDFIVQDQLADDVDAPAVPVTQKQQALWFIQKRRGCVMVEMPLLYQNFQYRFLITDSSTRHTWQCSTVLGYAGTVQAINCIAAMQATDLQQQLQPSDITLTIGGVPVAFSYIGLGDPPRTNHHRIGSTPFYYLVRVISPVTGVNELMDLPNINSKLEFLFPDFVQTFSDVEFRKRLNFFLGNELPVNAVHRAALIRASLVSPLITAYVDWHESMRCYDLNYYPNPASVTHAWNLLLEVMQTYTPLTE